MTLNSKLPGMNVPKNASDTIQLSRLFFDELLAESETLTGIAEVYGNRTLADLMYLHSAITSNGFIDLQHDNGESKILDVVSNLPNQSLWMKYIQTDDNQIEAHQVETDAGRPKVYIQINGGICYWNSEGDVDVHVIDFDNTPDASIPDAFKHLSENLKAQ